MNGFANGIMSMLLGWLRVVISNLWRLLTSADGSLFFQFMSEHWKGILTALLLGGLVIDRLVYFLRWRPDYIWASRRAAKRGRKAKRRSAEDELPSDERDYESESGVADEYGNADGRCNEGSHASQYAVDGADSAANVASGSTRAYAPMAAGGAPAKAGYSPIQTSYAPAQASYAPAQPGYAPSATGIYTPAKAGYATAQAGNAASAAGGATSGSTRAYAPMAAGGAPAKAGYSPIQTSYAPAQASYAPAQPGYAPSATAVYSPMQSPTRKAHTHPGQSAGAAFDTTHGTFAPPAKATVDGEAAQSRISVQKQSVKPLYSSRGTTPQSDSFAESTRMFAPMARAASSQPTRIRAIGPLTDMAEPIFDDDPPALTYSAKQGEGRMSANPAKGMVNSFGNAMPEPAAYLRDMSAGFAPQLPPERMYPPNDEPRLEDAAKQQIHPGLDSEAFRQSFGLDRDVGSADSIGTSDSLSSAGSIRSAGSVDAAYAQSNIDPAPPETPPAFTPYAEALDSIRQPSGRRANPFAVLAKKARDLVGVEDGTHKLTIRDLQSTVDMRKAFREPVYPRPKPDDDSEG